MSPPLFDGPAPPAPLFEGPLYHAGRRRPGPNRWGFDPFAPELDPEPARKDPHPICVEAARHWRDRETFEQRHRTHAELIRRRKKGARRQRRGDRIGRYLEQDTEVKHHKRGDRVSVQHRILAWCALRASLRSGEVGIWDGKGLKPCDREKLARYVRVPFRRDEKGRARCDRLDRALADLVAAGLLMRFQTRELEGGVYHPDAATLKVTPLFWLVSGVGERRDRAAKKAKKNAAKLQRRRDDPAAQARGYVSHVAAGAVPDYGPQGPTAGREELDQERRRMRDEYQEIRRRPYKPDDPPPK